MASELIYDFNKNSNLENWTVVDDGVMGGLSQGHIELNGDGHGVFEGTVSLENNGGFSSVRYNDERRDVKNYGKIVIRLKGDGKAYQFRIRDNSSRRYSYIYPFMTSGKWEEIEIPLDKMYPSFRGRKLDLPNFDRDAIEEVAFLIGNKRNEDFRLMIDYIELQ